MNKKQAEVLQFLFEFKTAREDQIIRLTKCTKEDIEYLLYNKLIVKGDRPGTYYHKLKSFDIKFVIALDFICRGQKEITNYTKGKFPVTATFIVDNTAFDVIVARTMEQKRIFQELDKISSSDGIIIVIEDGEKCDISEIKTKREVLICTYPIKVVAKVN